jgi:membrane protease YdiL (CAAX protease family)
MQTYYKESFGSLKSSPVLIVFSVVFYYFQIQLPQVYSQYFGVYDPKTIPCFLFFAFYTLLWFLAFPAATNKIFFKENIKEMGLALPENYFKAILLIALSLIIVLPEINYFAHLTQFRNYSLGNTYSHWIWLLFPIYYLGEEFFFRGFLFLGLWKRIGWHSFWLTDIVFTLCHIGKPPLEILMCIPVSIILNALTLMTRSIYPAVVVHTTMGIALSFMVSYQ